MLQVQLLPSSHQACARGTVTPGPRCASNSSFLLPALASVRSKIRKSEHDRWTIEASYAVFMQISDQSVHSYWFVQLDTLVQINPPGCVKTHSAGVMCKTVCLHFGGLPSPHWHLAVFRSCRFGVTTGQFSIPTSSSRAESMSFLWRLSVFGLAV